jgi:hypothetical protein
MPCRRARGTLGLRSSQGSPSPSHKAEPVASDEALRPAAASSLGAGESQASARQGQNVPRHFPSNSWAACSNSMKTSYHGIPVNSSFAGAVVDV